jgi:hypothetical protein
VNSEAAYAKLLRELALLRKQFRDYRTRSVLVNLARLKKKSVFIGALEKELEIELATHRRGQKIDDLLEILEDEITDYKFVK